MRAGTNGATSAPRSPLYTSRSSELGKRIIISRAGRDNDGAYRAFRRIDREDQQ